MEKSVEFIKWFSELNKDSVATAGGKGASLAEMYNAKVPVPAGFVVTAQAYEYFLSKTGIDEEMRKITSGLDVSDTAALNEASGKIRKLIEGGEMPADLEEEIVEAYDVLDADKGKGKDALEVLEKKGEPFVAVRSSATAEDLEDASFAGQQESFLNVRGKEELLVKVKKCMSSLYTPRATFYREKKGFKHEETFLAVVVQKMINSKKSGVMFSRDPTGASENIIIEAVWGLGEGIVSGQIKPDHYVVDSNLEDFKIITNEVSDKKIAIVRKEDGGNETVKLNEDTTKTQVLDSYQIKRLAQYGRQLEEHYKKPQDVEFAIEDKEIYIVQSRPVTTIKKVSEQKSGREIKGEEILSGFGASPGIGSGVVKIVNDLKELEKIQEGDVLVTEMTNPDMVVAMKKAAAIVTDEGGTTSHAAIVSREMGIPCVVGTEEATKKLKDGDEITIDGCAGKVYSGKSESKKVEIEEIVPTKTEIKVIADLPEGAERAAKSKAKGIGLTRLEGIIAEGGKHPMYFVKKDDMSGYIKILSEGLKKIAGHFEKIWIRTSDIRTDEYKELEGAPQEAEGNPMLGDHGVRFSLKNRKIMEAELKAVKEVADDFSDKEFGIMMPQIISVKEVQETKKIAEEIGIPDNIKIGIMVETPAAVQTIEEFCKEGIAFVSFGTNDLTQFTLAIDRNNENVQELFDETHPAVVNSVKHVIEVCKKYKVKTSICGQAGSKPAMAKILVEAGIDSISVNADAAKKISEVVAGIEGSGGEVGSDGGGSGGEMVKSGVSAGSSGDDKVEAIQGEGDGTGEEKDVDESVEAGEVEGVKEATVEDIDIDETFLKALGGEDYVPGENGDEKEDVPPLNEAIPVGSEHFAEGEDSGEREIDNVVGEEEMVKSGVSAGGSGDDKVEGGGEVIEEGEEEVPEENGEQEGEPEAVGEVGEGGAPDVEKIMKAEMAELQARGPEIEQSLIDELQARVFGGGDSAEEEEEVDDSGDLVEVLDDGEEEEDPKSVGDIFDKEESGGLHKEWKGEKRR